MHGTKRTDEHQLAAPAPEVAAILRRRRTRFAPSEAAALRAWLLTRDWVSFGAELWCPPEVVHAHQHSRDWGRVWADYDLHGAALEQARRESEGAPGKCTACLHCHGARPIRSKR